MSEHDLEKLLGGFAADTLTANEKQQLYRAALQDQVLFNALADEQALKELLADPLVRRRLLESLRTSGSATAESSSSWLDWFRRPAGLAWTGGLTAAVFAVVLGTRIYQDSVKEAGRSIATEEAPPAAPPASAPSLPQPTAPSSDESRSNAQDHQKLAVSPKKEAPARKPAKREATATTTRDERRAQDSSGFTRPQQREEDALQKRAESTPDRLASSEEETSASGDQPPTHTPSATASVPAPDKAPVASALSDQASAGLSARSLFYGETAGVDAGLMPEENERSHSAKQFEKFSQKKGPSSANKTGERAGSVTPLGIRYSLVANGTEEPHQGSDAGADSQTDSVDLMIEANQDGFFQVWGEEESLPLRLLFPLTEEEPVLSRLIAYQRRRIPIPVLYRTITVRFSRIPFRTLTKEDVVAMKRGVPGHFQESDTALGASGSQVTTTYVVNQDPSLQKLHVTIPMGTP